MLQVAVHDQAGVGRRRREPLEDGAAEPAVCGDRGGSSRTGSAADAATSRITSGVASVLSSTKMISASMPRGLRRDTTNQLRDVGSFVVRRDDDRELHARLSSHVPAGARIRRSSRLHAGEWIHDFPLLDHHVFGADWCRDCVRTKNQLDSLGVTTTTSTS